MMLDLIKRKYSILKLKRKKNRYLKNENLHSEGYFEIYPETSISGKLGHIYFGDNCFVRGRLEIQRKGGQIKIGDNVYIGDNTRIWAADLIDIGNNVLIAHNCNIFDNNTHPTAYLDRRRDFRNICMGGV